MFELAVPRRPKEKCLLAVRGPALYLPTSLIREGRKRDTMISSFGESFSLAIDHTRGSNTTAKNVTDDVCRASYSFCDRIPVAQPPSHPTATREVGKLLDLGLALGHQRFELVSLAERDDAGMVAAHAWAETRDGELEYPENKYPSAGVHVSIGRSSTTPVRTQSRPRPCSHSDSRSRGVWNENISREVRRGANSRVSQFCTSVSAICYAALFFLATLR